MSIEGFQICLLAAFSDALGTKTLDEFITTIQIRHATSEDPVQRDILEGLLKVCDHRETALAEPWPIIAGNPRDELIEGALDILRLHNPS